MKVVSVVCVLLLVGLVSAGSAPQKAFVWPMPRSLTTGNETTGIISPRGFAFSLDSSTKMTDLLRAAFDRHFRYAFENRAVRCSAIVSA
jgi:hypothetical protein